MTDIATLKIRNRARWSLAKITRGPEFDRVAKRLVAAKDRYKAVADKTGVPWFVIAVIHEREASQKWNTQLGQGDPLNRVSTHVPKGRGPFKTWEDGAFDALVNCAPFAGKWKDWTPGGTMTLLEEYNGLGYAARGLPSPYVWSGTDQYVKGKYVADGQFDPGAVDQQLGCAGLILAMRKLDTSVSFGEAIPQGLPPDAPAPVKKDTPGDPAPQANWFIKLINAIFGTKG
jgi:lysozyme family protein